MSYDLMVFDPEVAPRDRAEFLSWYRKQTEWSEGHSYNDPEVCPRALRAWFLDIIEDYPAMNGPYATEDFDDPTVTDYSIGRSVIYAAFAWSQCQGAYRTVFDLARKHGVGFYDVSGEEGQVWVPDSNDGFFCIHSQPVQPIDPGETKRRRWESVKRIAEFFNRDKPS